MCEANLSGLGKHISLDKVGLEIKPTLRITGAKLYISKIINIKRTKAENRLV